jgi:hypothetical protein
VSDLLGSLGDALGGDQSEGAIAYARGAWLWGAASRGESFTSAYQAMVGTPAGIRRDQALAMWQDIQTTLSEAGGAGAIGFDQLASGAWAEAVPDNWTGQFTYRVNFTSRTKDSYGDYQLESTPKWFITSSVLTPEQAVNAAMNMISLPAGVGTPDGIEPVNVVMANLSGAWYRTQPGILGSV